MERPASGSFSPRIIAVGGGKGGVGKSMLSAGLALALARMGHRILAIDLDLGGANMHTWLGQEPDGVNLTSFLNRSVDSLELLARPTSEENLRMIHGPRQHLAASNLKFLQKVRIHKHLKELPYDWIILDLGAGTSYNVLDFFLLSDRSIVVCSPEPTSIENIYRFLRASFFRKLAEADRNAAYVDFVRDRQMGKDGGAGQNPRHILSEIRKRFPDIFPVVCRTLDEFEPLLVVNQIITDDDRLLEAKIRIAVQRFLGLNIRTLGLIRHDEVVLRSIRNRQHPMQYSNDSFAALDLMQIAQRVVRGATDEDSRQSSFSFARPV